MKLDERLDDAFRSLTSGLAEPPAIERVAKRRTRRRAIAALGMVAVVALVGVVALRGGGGSRTRSIVANGGSDTTGVDTRFAPVDYRGVQLFVPTTWMVIHNGCPGGDHTLLLGPAREGCREPSTGATWLWIAPAASRPARERKTCRSGGSNDVRVCSVFAEGRPGVEFVVGTDSALVTSGALGQDRDFDGALAVTQTLRYDTTSRPDSGVVEEQVGDVYQLGLTAYLTGDCAGVRALAEAPKDIKCPAGVASVIGPDGTVPFPTSTEFGGAVSGDGRGRVAVKVTYDEHTAYRIDLQHEWSTTEHKGIWKLLDIAPTDPAVALPTDEPAPAVECTTVHDFRGRQVGCVHPVDTEIDTEHRDAVVRRYGGIPVYAKARSGHIVGVIAQGQGFVPQRLVPRVTELQGCTTAARVHRADHAKPSVSNDCRTLLHGWGMTDRQIDLTG
jgi:hypothetical protein